MKELMKYLKNYKKESILAPVFKLIEVIFDLLVPWVVAAIIDNGINAGEGVGYVLICCAILLGFGVLGLAMAVTAQYFAAKAAVGFAKELRSDLYRKIASLSFSELDAAGTSKLITRMTVDVNNVMDSVNRILRLILRFPIVVVGSMIMAFLISWEAGVVVTVGCVVMIAVIVIILIFAVPLNRKVQAAVDDVTLKTRETLTGVRVIRAFCREKDDIKAYRSSTSNLYRRESAAGFLTSLVNPLTYAVVNVMVIVLIYVGAIGVGDGSLSQGNVVSLYNYMAQILVETLRLASHIVVISRGFASAQRITGIFHMGSTPRGGEKTEEIKNAPFISFDNVSMRYGETGDLALDGISFTAERGDVVGVIGGTGAGKSTLINLIPHFYDASDGKVEIDGVNVNAVGDRKLREMCGIVPQKAVLFKGTVRDNILWGSEASDEEVMKALGAAQGLDIIDAKAGGLDEPVDEGGSNFSGGQKQRLTIARALVRRPEILILDDSASALDFATDARLRMALKNLDYDPLIFIVSQRTSSVMDADKILVLDEGKAVGVGTHEELLKNCPLYEEIHYTQYEREGPENA
ncbi:MAG: ABC transporter ATP-binding protein/permease [Clostridia bacterium]|nr:ABC transporter ATP-binding protein/permease [Clostridia bacterium]